MIKLTELTPNIYNDASRDFQFIGHLYDTVLNYIKTNSDLIYNIPLSDNSDTRLVELMATTLGFKSRHKYNVKQLVALCSVFSTIIRQKGTLNAIDTAGKALLTAEGITEDIFVELDPEDRSNLTISIFVPQELTDLNLLKDLLLYVLPAGCSCNIVRELRQATTAEVKIGITQKANIYQSDNSIWREGDDFNAIYAGDISIVPEMNPNLTDAYAKGTPGIFINSTIVRPGERVTSQAGTLSLQNTDNQNTDNQNTEEDITEPTDENNGGN